MNEFAYQPVSVAIGAVQPEKPRQNLRERLEAQPDDALRALISEAGAIIESRAAQRRRDAISEIQRLAKENGLAVDVKKPARKRGRPRKAGPAA